MRAVIDLASGLTHGLATRPALEAAGEALARRLAAPAATLAHGFAGAVLLALLAIRPRGRRLVYLAAHDIAIAGPLRDLIGLAGGMPAPVGSVDRALTEELEAALAADAVAMLHLADEHGTGPHVPPLPVVRRIAHLRGLPTIVLAPGGPDVEPLLDAGADLVVIDAAMCFAGPPLGIVAGRADLVARAREAALAGPGRLAAPAPDHLALLLGPGFADDRTALAQARGKALAERLVGRPGLRVLPMRSGAYVAVDPAEAGTTARDLAAALASGDPAILVDDSEAGAGRLALDLRPVDEAGFAGFLDRLAALLDGPVPSTPWP